MFYFQLLHYSEKHLQNSGGSRISGKGVCNCSMYCCTLLYVHSSFAIILMGKRELVALLSLSSLCLVIVVWLFLAVPWFFSAVCECGIS